VLRLAGVPPSRTSQWIIAAQKARNKKEKPEQQKKKPFGKNLSVQSAEDAGLHAALHPHPGGRICAVNGLPVAGRHAGFDLLVGDAMTYIECELPAATGWQACFTRHLYPISRCTSPCSEGTLAVRLVRSFSGRFVRAVSARRRLFQPD
jgi:hypothetical protein